MIYRGWDTLLEYLRLELPDGEHSIVTRDDVILDLEVINHGDVEYSVSPDLGTSSENMLVLVYDNLTINAGVVLTPANPRRGMCLYVRGELTNNGVISMTARGVEAEGQDVHLYLNEYVPAVGALGGESQSFTGGSVSGAGIPGRNGKGRQAGGGASASFQQIATAATTRSGAGGHGTSYSGGTGGGAAVKEGTATGSIGGAGSDSGGPGGNGVYRLGTSAVLPAATGGAGNPGGIGANPRVRPVTQLNGSDGTGGLLIIFANHITQLGAIESKGSTGGISGTMYGDGGSSGGGSINIFYVEMDSGSTDDLSAAGGESRTSNYGGNGSVSLDRISEEAFFIVAKEYVSLANMADFLKRVRINVGQSSTGMVGEVFWWSLDIPPVNTLLCDGSAVSRDEYSELFDVIGEHFGAGDGSTTFNLPNMMIGHVTGDPIPCIRVESTELLWCSGYFQDRSIAANIYAALTPIVSDGEITMVNGNRFVAQSDGLYGLLVGGGAGSASGTINSIVTKNYEAITTSSIPDVLGSISATTSVIPSLSIIQMMEVDDYLIHSIRSSVAQTTINATTTIVKFTFARLV